MEEFEIQANLDPAIGRMFPSGLSKGDRKKAEIILAIVDIVTQEGFEGLSFERIGKATKMAKSHVLYHYKSKDLMILRAFQYIINFAQVCVLGELRDAKPGLDRLVSYARGHFVWAENKPEHLYYFSLCYARCAHHPELFQFNHEARLVGRSRVKAIFREGTRAHEQTLESWAVLFHEMLTGVLISSVVEGRLASKEEVQAKKQVFLETIKAMWKQGFPKSRN